jgi:cytoskeletal protein CcmA (bactofilin family)
MNWLNQKNEPEPTQPTRPSQPSHSSHSSHPHTPQAAVPPPVTTEHVDRPAASTGASIGKSIHVKGELTGSEDLVIEGKVEGKITLNGCRVTVGRTGQVSAEIVAKIVVVSGQVTGNVRAEERVEVAATGSLVGDVHAPRVALIDGARFKGSIDMEPATGRATAGTSSRARDEAPAYASAGKDL